MEPVTNEAETSLVSDDASAPGPLQTDMHPIAEHPAAEAEAATETATEVLGRKHCLLNKPTHCAATSTMYLIFKLQRSMKIDGERYPERCWA